MLTNDHWKYRGEVMMSNNANVSRRLQIKWHLLSQIVLKYFNLRRTSVGINVIPTEMQIGYMMNSILVHNSQQRFSCVSTFCIAAKTNTHALQLSGVPLTLRYRCQVTRPISVSRASFGENAAIRIKLYFDFRLARSILPYLKSIFSTSFNSNGL